MSVDVTSFHTKLSQQISSSDTILKLDDEVDIRDDLNNTKVVFLQIYTAGRSEIVLVHKIEDGDLIMARGYDGTTAQIWPAESCICAVRVVDGPVCVDEDDENQSSSDCSLNIVEGSGITVVKNGDTVTISLKNTGVTAGVYGGATVNSFGQFTDIPDTWPNVIDYNPCPCE